MHPRKPKRFTNNTTCMSLGVAFIISHPFLMTVRKRCLFFLFLSFAVSPFAESLDYLSEDEISISADWKRNYWFGYYHDDGSGWIYHQELGWIYPNSTDENSIWLYLDELDWVWTRSDFYPWLYFHKLENWRFYENELSTIQQ